MKATVCLAVSRRLKWFAPLLALVPLVVLGVSVADGERAVVINLDDQSWDLYDGNGHYMSATLDVHIVVTPSKNGNVNVTVHGDVPNDTGGTVRWDGANNPEGGPVLCHFWAGEDQWSTYEWSETISPGGRVVLKAKIHMDLPTPLP